MPEAIEEQITDILCEHLGISKGECLLVSNLKDDLGADELDMVEIVMAVEEAFGICIADEDAEKFITPACIAAYIKERKQ